MQIQGYLPGGLPEEELKNSNFITHARVCWGGCQNGLMEEGLEVDWSEQAPGHFSLQMIVPTIPWMAADGLHALKPRDYSIVLIDLNLVGCKPSVASGKECPIEPQISATFHLTSGYRGSECQSGSCAVLRVEPSEAAPGDAAQATGWAPLLQIIGRPFGYYLVLVTNPTGTSYSDLSIVATVQQQIDGSLKASFQVPQYGIGNTVLTPGNYTLALLAGALAKEKGSPPILSASTTFVVAPAPDWTGLQRSAPLWIESGASLDGQLLGHDPLDPERLAYCGQGRVQLSQNGGRTWDAISTLDVSGQQVALGIAVVDPRPRCIGVTLDSTHPNSIYAVFEAVSKLEGARPVYYVGFMTGDHGQTWRPVPVPSVQTGGGEKVGEFGGFWTDGKVVQALYVGEPAAPGENAPILAKETADGGVSWTTALLRCPTREPCLRWGPAAAGLYGMGAELPQGVVASFDGGQSWISTGESVDTSMSSPRQLVGLSPEQGLLISSNSSYPLRYTPDGGRTWQTLALPPLPGTNMGWPSSYPGLQMLPSGDLVGLNPDTGQWWELPIASSQWCQLQTTSPGRFQVAFQVSGDLVWWLSPAAGEADSAPLSRFACGP